MLSSGQLDRPQRARGRSDEYLVNHFQGKPPGAVEAPRANSYETKAFETKSIKGARAPGFIQTEQSWPSRRSLSLTTPRRTRIRPKLLGKEGGLHTIISQQRRKVVLTSKANSDLILMDVVMPGLNRFQQRAQYAEETETHSGVHFATEDQETDESGAGTARSELYCQTGQQP